MCLPLGYIAIPVDLGVEEDEQREGNDAEDDESAPVVVVGIHGMTSHVRDPEEGPGVVLKMQ